jgi:hypothetical protein
MQIMQKQALAAQIAKYQQEQSIRNQQSLMPPPSAHNMMMHQQIVYPQVTNDMLPVHISCDYQDMPFNYSTKINGNANSNSEESDSNSFCSSRSTSCSPTSEESSIESESDSDIEIDVEDCSDDNTDINSYYLMETSLDHIPLTVLQLESKLREKMES